jgi:hypothetical protein
MTFLEAAIELLRQAQGPLTIQDLTARAVEQRLLTHAGRSPKETMQARLAQELKKPNTLLTLTDAGEYGLKRYDKPRLGEGAEPPVVEEISEVVADADAEADLGADEDAEPGEAAADAAAPAGKRRRRRRRGGRGRGKKKAAEAAAAQAGAPADGAAEAVEPAHAAPEPGTPEEALAAEALAEEAEREAAQAAVADAARRVEEAQAAAYEPPPSDEPAVDLDAFMSPTRTRRGVIDLPDEEALKAEYGDELVGEDAVTPPVEGELVDEHTADEDRPLMDEITADSRDRDRRGRRGRDRGGRGHGREAHKKPAAANGQAQAKAAPAAAAPSSAVTPAMGTPAAPVTLGAGASLVEVGYQLLRAIGGPVHARQLGQMAQKRGLLPGDPEDVWRALRAALLDDARARQGRGLRPRVRHAGSGHFALATARLDGELAALEDGLAQKADALARETRNALRRRIAKLPVHALTQLARVFLERTGHTEVEIVKRVEQTTYLSARARRGAVTARVMVGVRAGSEEGGRRAVGELRAGVMAKQLDEGVLLLCTRLGQEGEKELRQPGPPILALDGDAFAEALVTAGVGVMRVAMPIAYLDADFFAELTEGS